MAPGRKAVQDFGITDNVPISFFSMIPHMIDDAPVSPEAKCLYLHLKRVTGEGGICWHTQDALAKHCGFSPNTIVRAKRELVKERIIEVKLEAVQGHPRHVIHLLNLWPTNESKYRQSVHLDTDVIQAQGIPQSVQTDTDIGIAPPITKKNPEEEPLKNKIPCLSKIPIFAELQTFLGYPEKTNKDPIPNYGKEAAFIARMGKRGYSESEILAYWKQRMTAAGGVYVEAWKINEDIGKGSLQGRYSPRQPALLPSGADLEADARAKGFTT